MKQIVFAIGCSLAAACGSGNTQVQCTANLIPAILLTVRDGQNGAIISSQATVIAALRGAKPDTIINAPGDPIEIGELPGTYDLLVRKTGYADWTDTNLVVASMDAGCKPVTVTLQAVLQKLP